MINEKINLKNFYPNLNNDVYLTTYCQDNYDEFSKDAKRKCLIVVPGGGYAFTSDREAEPVALRFAGYDIACFVLKYTVAPNIKYPAPLEEVLASIAYIRSNADKYHINVNSISLLGFSAGGHLAISACCYYDDKDILNKLGLTKDETKINGLLLGYPVVTENGHKGTIDNITEQNKTELLEKFSLENHISSDFPRTFIFHTSEDNAVDVNNSLILASKLRQNKIPFEMHIYPYGWHGESLADESVYYNIVTAEQLKQMEYNTSWAEHAIKFIKTYI